MYQILPTHQLLWKFKFKESPMYPICNVIDDYQHAVSFWNQFIISVTSRTDYQIQLPSMKNIVTVGPYNVTNIIIVTLALFCILKQG